MSVQLLSVKSEAPMTIARDLLEHWETPKKRYGVMAWKGTFWEWHGNRWEKRDREHVVSAALMALEGAIVMGGDPLTVNSKMATEVVRCIEAIAEVPHEKLPVWLERMEAVTDPMFSVAFEDVVVDVKKSALEGKVVTVERDERLFGGMVLKCGWNPKAECPTWDRCCREWGTGPQWTELLERFCGYCTMGDREQARALGQFGENRGGKGTPIRVMKRLMGEDAVKEKDVTTFSDQYGLAGLPGSQVLVLTEMNELDSFRGEIVTSRLKQILGGDGMTVNGKYDRFIEVRLGVAPILQANEMPKLPNKGEGLTSKLLILPYTKTFLGREDVELEAKLWGEREGIARKWVEAAVRLMAEKNPMNRWPVAEEAERVMQAYLRSINQLEQFVADVFIKEPQAVVTTEAVRGEYIRWCEEMEVRPVVSTQGLVEELFEKIPWHLTRYRAPGGGQRMVKGMAMKRRTEDT